MSFKQLFDPASFTYTYLIADDATHEAVLIDPVLEQVERDVRLLRERGLTLRYTLETHVHADHITGALAIKQATGAQTVVAQDCNAEGYDRYLVDGNVILFGQEEIVVIATPGHTPGSLSMLVRQPGATPPRERRGEKNLPSFSRRGGMRSMTGWLRAPLLACRCEMRASISSLQE